MSWSDARVAVILFLLAWPLAGCGFEPLYGNRGVSGAGAETALASVRIAPIEDRTGQQLYNFLRDRLNPQGLPGDPRYLLSVSLTEHIDRVAFQRDETATRANLTLDAEFSLADVATGTQLYRGRSRTTTSYDILRAQYATLVAAADARKRSARGLSDDIANQVALFLTRPSSAGDPPS